MRTLLLAAVAMATLSPGVAVAQSAGEVRHDTREVNKDRREVRRDVARGDYREARHDRRELREDRQERREDWQEYRRTHRDAFRRSAYVAPRGYAYRPVSAGVRLNGAFWGSNYRINNYSTYRLPYPGRNMSYVRYGNDVLLVNVRTGRVVRVYNGFFW